MERNVFTQNALAFPEHEIGSRMTGNFICIRSEMTIREAMRALVSGAAENDNISTLFVARDDGTFIGSIELKDLIIARETAALGSIIRTACPYVYSDENVDDCIDRIRDMSEDSIPVLDRENRLLGVLLPSDVSELIGEEMDEDYARLGGLSDVEDLREPLGKSIAKRLPWLSVLLGLGLVVSTVVSMFEGVVAHIALIVSFQSLVLGMAGNAGTQSLAVTIRVISDSELSFRQRLGLVFKEARVGAVNGLILGMLSFLLIGLYLVLFKSQTYLFAFSVSACTGLALAVSIMLSSIFGTGIPLIFKRLGIDPAVASGPFITTVNDLIAVVTYYGLAYVLLIRVLGI